MTLPASTPCWFDSSEAGAPTLNNAAGSLLEVLRSCLINGFGAVSVTSIVVASGVATVTAATHGFSAAYGKLVLIEGAPVSELNGRKRIGNVLTNTFTFPAPGVADGTYTGTISAKRAPLGWAETHTGTNIAIFASTAPEARPNSLRVDDSGSASMSRWVGIPTASITDLNTYSGEFPSSAQVSGGAYVQRGGTNNATPKAWVVAGDDRGFYFAAECNTGPVFLINWFGDFESFYEGDAGGTLLATQTTTAVSNSPSWGLANGTNIATNPTVNVGCYAPRGVLLAETAPALQSITGAPGNANQSGSTQYQNAGIYANPVIQDLVYVISTGPCIRGRLPGLAWLLANGTTTGFGDRQVVAAGSKQFLHLPTRTAAQTAHHCIRLDGWR